MRAVGLILAWAMAAASAGAADESPMTVFLRKTVLLSDAQMTALEAGDVVTKQLAADEKPDVAVFGAVKIAASPETYLTRFKDIAAFRRSPSATEIGRFGDTPDVRDVATLTLEDEDFAAARNCRPGKCDLKLARSAIERMHAQINWQAADARSRATAVLREVMVDFVTAYRRNGAAELATYLDKEHPVDASNEFQTLLESTRYLITFAPEFHRYVASYPGGTLQGAEDFFYWIKEKSGPKPVVSVYHVSLWRDPRGPVFVSSKQIYSSHYVRVGLDLVALVPAKEPAQGSYLLDLYRARIDPPGGLIGAAIIGKIRGSAENSLRESLRAAKTRTLSP